MFSWSRLRQLTQRTSCFQVVISRGLNTSNTNPSVTLGGHQAYSLFTDVVKPTVFGVGASAAAFSVAAHLYRRKQEHSAKRTWGRGVGLSRRVEGVSLSSVEGTLLSKLPAGAVRDTALSLLVHGRTLQPHQQTLYGITGVNILVLVGWRFRPLQGFMQRNFLHHFPPIPNRTYTLLTSTFSHKTIPHILFNSIALISFGGAIHDRLGREQFAAFFVAGGLASSVVSHLARVKSRPGGASLGSSGAVYAIFAMMAVFEPQAKAAFILLPGVPIALEHLFPALVLLDVVGALSRWRFLDHWGHLGGALFGYLYAKYGQTYLWKNRDKLLLPSS